MVLKSESGFELYYYTATPL